MTKPPYHAQVSYLLHPLITDNTDMVTEKARTMSSIRQDLNSLDATDLAQVKSHVEKLEIRNLEIDIIRQSLVKLDPSEFREAQRYILQLENRHSPLLRLPRELREEIYDLIALGEARKLLTDAGYTDAGSRSKTFLFRHLCAFANACQQLKSEAQDGIGRLEKLGLVVKRISGQGGNTKWKQIAASTINDVPTSRCLMGWYPTVKDAMNAVEREGFPTRYGVIYFTTAVEMRAKLFEF